MIPGSNLLNMAFQLIAKQTVTYYAFLGRVENDVGQDVTEYAAPAILRGSFQPVPRALYELYGLDLQKTYYTFYVSYDLLDIDRDVSGDQIAFGSRRFQCVSDVDWFEVDGWKAVLCVYIGPDIAHQTAWGFNAVPPINTNVNFNNGNFLGSQT